MAKKTNSPTSATVAGARGQVTAGAAAVAVPATPKMTEDQVEKAMSGRPDWVETGGAIQRTFQFKNFVDAMAFVNSVATAAETVNHHPDILVRYNKVTITLSTHDAGGITARDFDLAAKLDAMI
ncbi:MAG: 4a-hydroxytetrahydrobiopterin dehydratase [Phycisphaerales bacterium]